jgi:hypothetical protein
LAQGEVSRLDRLPNIILHRGRTDQEQRLFRAVLNGRHRLLGLCNSDVAEALYCPTPIAPLERRRRTACVSCQLQLLRAHGLIRKIPRRKRYQVTTKGEAIMGAALYIRHKMFPRELEAA